MAVYPGNVRNPVTPWSAEEEAYRLGYVTFKLAPGEKLLTCPYRNRHRILEDRFAHHLIKCRANYLKEMTKNGKSPKYKICRYNYKHHFPQIEMQNHEMRCPDAASVVDHLQKYPCSLNFKDELKARSKAAEQGKGDAKSPNVTRDAKRDEDREDAESEGANAAALEINDAVMEEESWDAEVEENLRNGYVTYNPKIYLAQNEGKIIQQPGGITTKSERKAFRDGQYAAFEARGGDFYDDEQNRDRNGWTGPGPAHEPERMTESEIRLKRARELATAQKNSSFVAGHLDPQNHKRGGGQSDYRQNRKRRSYQAVEQINNFIRLAQPKRQRSSRICFH